MRDVRKKVPKVDRDTTPIRFNRIRSISDMICRLLVIRDWPECEKGIFGVGGAITAVRDDQRPACHHNVA